MKTLKSITNGNSIILIFCFFLPFIVPMCSEEKSESYSADSTSISTSSYETLDTNSTKDTLTSATDTMSSEDSISTNGTMDKEKSKDEEEENKFIKFIMMPDGKNASGIGFMYHYTLFGVSIVSLPVSFILIFLTFIIRKWNLKFTLFAIGFISFVCFGVLNRKEIVYGYWITLVFYVNAVFLHWWNRIKEIHQIKNEPLI